MSKWSKKIAAALRDPQVGQGFAEVAREWMQRHIDENIGRREGGGMVQHAPLAQVSGTRWVRRPRKTETILKRRTRKVGRREVTESLVRVDSYRSGGQPLRDTGHMWRSLSANSASSTEGIKLTLHGPIYAIYQDKGFTTKGPNYIPLSLKGKRGHGTGNNPSSEGLTRNKDFIMVIKGVTVPSRPFLLPLPKDIIALGHTIRLGLSRIFKGTQN